MSITLREILDRQQVQENRIEICCAAIRDRTPDVNVRLLTYYLARRRKHQERAFGNLPAKSVRQALATAVDAEALPPGPVFPNLTDEDAEGGGLARTALRHARALIVLYRTLLELSPNDDAVTVLNALIESETRDISVLRKLLASHYF